MLREIEVEELKKRIIVKLSSKSYWGRRLINELDLLGGIPKEKRKQFLSALNGLFEEGLIIRKIGNRNQFRYSLRPSRKPDIEERLNSYLKSKGIDFKIYK